jgi:hypothetical protein
MTAVLERPRAMKAPKCRDCRYCRREPAAKFDKCGAGGLKMYVSPVEGYRTITYCEILRGEDAEFLGDTCGPAGHYFIPRRTVWDRITNLWRRDPQP